MGGEVENTSLFTHCQERFCSRWVTVSSTDLPGTGRHRAKHPQGKVPEGSAASLSRVRTSGAGVRGPSALGETAGPQPHPFAPPEAQRVRPDRRGAGHGSRRPRSRGRPFRAGSGASGRRSQIYVQAGGNVPGWEEPAAQPL